MSGKQEKQKKSNMPPPETRDFEVGDPVDSVESYVQELLHSMINGLCCYQYKWAYWRHNQGCRSIKS